GGDGLAVRQQQRPRPRGAGDRVGGGDRAVIAFLFPGQGSQAVGMGRALVEQFPEAREVFDEADAALGEALSRVIFEGPAERLTLTEYAQPAILTVSTAAYRVLA